MRFGEFDLSIIRESHFKLDGGAMYGVVPKTLWSKVAPCDEQNRVALACNLLFIKTPKGNVLVETGMGPRWSDKERERYEIKSLVDHSNVLEGIGLSNTDVDAVIISHMHFDHIGGAVIGEHGALKPAFPNAKYYVQKGEYELAKNANARARASYRPDDYVPLEAAGQLAIIDGDTEVVPGVWCRVTGGHTSHHQVIEFHSLEQKGVFFADIIPTKTHLSPPWVMGYDHFPLDSCDIKDEWLSRCAAEDYLVVFDHEIDVPWGHVRKVADLKFEWRPLSAETLASGIACVP